jgi:hypothetical protein
MAFVPVRKSVQFLGRFVVTPSSLPQVPSRRTPLDPLFPPYSAMARLLAQERRDLSGRRRAIRIRIGERREVLAKSGGRPSL